MTKDHRYYTDQGAKHIPKKLCTLTKIDYIKHDTI